MKIFAVLALFVACCYAAPANKENLAPMKGEAPLEELTTVTKGEQNTVEEETTGEVWIPFWSYISSWFNKEEAPKHNEIKSAKAETPKKPTREHFDDSGEFLEELNTYHFGESEEELKLVHVDSEEIRRSPHKPAEHVKDAILYNKVLPKRGDFSDYGDFLEASNRHIMGSPVSEKNDQAKVKSTWNTWFGK